MPRPPRCRGRIDALKRHRDGAGQAPGRRGRYRRPTDQCARRSGNAHRPRKKREARRRGGEYDTLKTRLEPIAAQAADFQALVDRVDALVRRTGTGEDGIVTVTAANSGSLGPLNKGSLLPPVVGTILPGGGGTAENAKENNKNPGLTYATPPGAQVIAPADGKVLFAGPYHKSGQVLILEITTGYDLVLAGLGRVTVRPNDRIAGGRTGWKHASRRPFADRTALFRTAPKWSWAGSRTLA